MSAPAQDPLRVLQRIRSARPRPGERCEMCASGIPDDHDHVVDVERRTLRCACRGCWLLFTADGAGAGRYRAVPDRCAAVEGFSMSPGTWASFQIPVEVAFFFSSSALDRVTAFYPSPAGATESLLPLDGWDGLVAANPVLAELRADVEALLLRVRRDGADAFVVPIDACYELVGLLRTLWRGFDGGRDARVAVDRWFAELAERAR